MSFKSSGPRTRPERVKPLADPISSSPLPSGWSATTNQGTSRHRRHSNASTNSTSSFHSATSRHGDDSAAEQGERFPPEEEASMISTSNSIKTTANAQFVAADYSSAISTYDKAVAELPSYLDYELAVLQSNIAACHLKLEQWKEALDACEAGLNGLEREMPIKRPKTSKQNDNKDSSTTASSSTPTNTNTNATSSSEDKIIELPSDATDAELATHIAHLNLSDARKTDITRIRLKLLLRRARARSSLTPSSWSHLAGALEDYKLLSSPDYLPQLPLADQKTVRKALAELPPKVNEAKDKEVGEMMGKLKDLGNGILKPFGLSTDMFKMTQDPGTGGWSMNFDQGGKGAGGGADAGTTGGEAAA